MPGDLFAVNEATTAGVDKLFARNERLVCYFTTAEGPVVLVLVGAIIVAGIETVWGGGREPRARRHSGAGLGKQRRAGLLRRR